MKTLLKKCKKGQKGLKTKEISATFKGIDQTLIKQEFRDGTRNPLENRWSKLITTS
jgi:hypothetical protein